MGAIRPLWRTHRAPPGSGLIADERAVVGKLLPVFWRPPDGKCRAVPLATHARVRIASLSVSRLRRSMSHPLAAAKAKRAIMLRHGCVCGRRRMLRQTLQACPLSLAVVAARAQAWRPQSLAAPAALSALASNATSAKHLASA